MAIASGPSSSSWADGRTGRRRIGLADHPDDREIIPGVGRHRFGLDLELRGDLRPRRPADPIINTVWVLLVPLLAIAIGLLYAIIVDRTPVEAIAKTLIFLPMAISMVGASVIWKFVYEYKPTQAPQIGLLNQVLKSFGFETKQFLIMSSLEQPLPDRRHDLDSGRIRDDGAVRGHQGDPRRGHRGGQDRRCHRLVVVPFHHVAEYPQFADHGADDDRDRCAEGLDIVRTMTGGNFGTSVVANDFYSSSFTQNQPGLGSALAVLLFILVSPIIVYNVRQLRQVSRMSALVIPPTESLSLEQPKRKRRHDPTRATTSPLATAIAILIATVWTVRRRSAC